MKPTCLMKELEKLMIACHPQKPSADHSDTVAITGWVLSAIFTTFMLGASALPKLTGMSVARQTMTELGWPNAPVFNIGVVEACLSLLFLLPRTALLAAVLMMGIFGGAIATQIRADSPLFSHVLFSVYLGAIMWLGLYLRDARVRAILPIPV